MTCGFILSDAATALQIEASRFRTRETGGMLIGYWSQSGRVVITHATGPGPNAEHSCRGFAPDHTYCQRILGRVFDESNGELSYMGDWHTHPWGSMRPSRRDIRTAVAIARDNDYRCPRPVIAIYRWPRPVIGELFGMWVVDAAGSATEIKPVTTVNEIPGYPLPKI